MNQERDESSLALLIEMQRVWNRHSAARLVEDTAGGPLDSSTRLFLRLIRDLGPIRSSDLALHVGLSRPAASRKLAALLDAGLIEVTTDPDDGRAAPVTLSPLGAENLERNLRDGAAAIKSLVADFTTTEIATLAHLLSRLNDNAASRQAPSPSEGPFTE